MREGHLVCKKKILHQHSPKPVKRKLNVVAVVVVVGVVIVVEVVVLRVVVVV